MSEAQIRTEWPLAEVGQHVDDALLSDEAVAQTRAHPDFRAAIETHAAAALRAFEAQDEASRWLTRDLGRTSLYLAAAILDVDPVGLSVASLAATAAATGVASRGRVLAFVQYAQANGRLVIPPGAETWTRRQLVLRPPFFEPLRRQVQLGMNAAGMVAPEPRAALAWLKTDLAVSAAVAAAGRLLMFRPDLTRRHGARHEIFLDREGGMLVLQYFLANQRPGRDRLLEDAKLSRAEISRRLGISRAHLNKLLGDAAEAGALTFESADQVVFDPGLCEDAERYFAGMFQTTRLVARAVLRAQM